MVLPRLRRPRSIGPRKLAGLSLCVLVTLGVWVWTGDLWLTAGVAAAATVGVVVAVAAVALRRRARASALARPAEQLHDIASRLRLARRRSMVQRRSRDMTRLVGLLRLDEAVRQYARTVVTTGGDAAIAHADRARSLRRVVRTPMPHGVGCVFLNRLGVRYPGGRLRLVEKGCWRKSREVSFWRAAAQGWLQLEGETYAVVPAVHQVNAEPVSVLYFPYLPDLDQAPTAARSRYREHLHPVARALAHFNSAHHSEAVLTSVRGKLPFRVRRSRPSVAALQGVLGVEADEAAALQATWDETEAGLAEVWGAYKRLPRCLCHHDPSPGNVIYLDGMARLLDFGLAGAGAIGSDMHCVIRWSPAALADEEVATALLRTYVEGVRECGVELTVAQAQLAAWTIFYLRYTDLTFGKAAQAASNPVQPGSTRPTAFRVALREMGRLIDDCAAANSEHVVTQDSGQPAIQ